MQSGIKVTNPPPKPLMVYDGDCRFCGLWIRRWQQMTGDAVDYLPSQDPQIASRFPEIQPKEYQTSVQLIEPGGAIFSGAEAVFRSLAKNANVRWPLHFYESSPLLADITEWSYRFVARHRTAFSFLTRVLWGKHVEWPEHHLTRWIFLRALGVIYLIAFISLWTQIIGLIGHKGIVPVDQYLPAIKQQCDDLGVGPVERFHQLPTLCWLNSSDGFLQFQCGAGVVLSILLFVGIAPAPALILLWLLYLSLTTVGSYFLQFQWDNLLLEAGFLSIFFAPWRLLPKLSAEAPPSRIALWLLRLLLFKLMFSSGSVKLVSGDPTWRNLTALTFHYYTQPLPTWIAWYANQSPLWFLKFSCAAMFVIELGAPFLIFMPRRIRFVGAAALTFLQVLILLTGNYTFFNWLTLALCLLLLDDFVLQRIMPTRFTQQHPERRPWLPVRLGFNLGLAVIFVPVSLLQIVMIPHEYWETAVIACQKNVVLRNVASVVSGTVNEIGEIDEKLSPFRTINGYGLFAVMTTSRHEIIVQGSNDGIHWLDYEFKYKPGDVNRRPRFVAPFQPRLDWQMWFAALGDYQQNPWFANFCVRLLQGSPQVLALLAKNPFPDKPPVYIRAEVYDYHFTNSMERWASGAWWTREYLGEYLPVVSLHGQ